jgi:hypothetical protein
MEEGMGVIRQGHALSEELGPGFGRGMGMTSQEQNISNTVGRRGDQAGQGDQNQHQHGTQSGNVEDKKRVPGYPQDDMMMMPMDEAVAKPENYGLAPGWSASLQGMMNLVRVLPPEKYEEVMKRVREGRTEKLPAPAHKHD